ncbi:DNA-binding transcriptional LysR family regulator [Acidovorax soli]|uniref:DNA-binding transcriptional LysR family regulator n=1 Tax=Acidovorax soli TaxID=592050 RepID=A0A7X0PGT5_9BURK|nr:LysR family transcriptional regulator [Acidovorax soli]MBB6561678.1 DNA-binding transcriptional LysR family regulator [Acidovorax soli]
MPLSLLSLPLRYFLEVARTGSVNQAAQRLHVAASAVSRQLAKLEDSLGVVLFERQTRGMRLTTAGERLLAHAGAHAQESAQLVEQLQGLAEQEARRVRLACTEGFAAGFMPLVMAQFREMHPEVELQLHVGVPEEVSAQVQRGDADLALKYSVAPEKGLAVLHSAIAPVFAITVAGHPLALQRSVSVADVVRYPLLLGTAGITGRQLFDLSCTLQGLRYTPAVVSNFSSALLPLLGPSDVALASYLTAARWVEEGVLAARPFEDVQLQQRRLQVLALDGRVQPALVQEFARVLVAAIEQYGKRKVGRRKRATS